MCNSSTLRVNRIILEFTKIILWQASTVIQSFVWVVSVPCKLHGGESCPLVGGWTVLLHRPEVPGLQVVVPSHHVDFALYHSLALRVSLAETLNRTKEFPNKTKPTTTFCIKKMLFHLKLCWASNRSVSLSPLLYLGSMLKCLRLLVPHLGGGELLAEAAPDHVDPPLHGGRAEEAPSLAHLPCHHILCEHVQYRK